MDDKTFELPNELKLTIFEETDDILSSYRKYNTLLNDLELYQKLVDECNERNNLIDKYTQELIEQGVTEELAAQKSKQEHLEKFRKEDFEYLGIKKLKVGGYITHWPTSFNREISDWNNKKSQIEYIEKILDLYRGLQFEVKKDNLESEMG